MAREKSQTIHHAYSSKAKSLRGIVARQRLLLKDMALTTGDRVQGRGEMGWYQLRKLAAQRLCNLSAGTIILFEGGYRGDQSRHWMQDLRCGHVFRASIGEIVIGGAKNACPFCHTPQDMSRFGSVEAVQELVHQLSHGNVHFSPENDLRSAGDQYDFLCTLAKIRCQQTFRDFMKNIQNDCATCAFKSSHK